MNQHLAFASQVARQAGAVAQDHFDRTGSFANIKGDASVVTEADLAADQLITQAIVERFPKDDILSEELNTRYDMQGDAAWVVDPLDGTTNFSLGFHVWGVSVARVTDTGPDTAAIYFPIIDELYCAQKGSGATLNGVTIRIKPYDPNQPAAFFSCCTRTHRHYEVKIPYKTRILGSAAYSLCMVARGSALLAFEATPKIWDLAGGWLIVQEAGGVVAPLHGDYPFPMQGGVDYSQLDFPTVAAATPDLLSQAKARIKPR